VSSSTSASGSCVAFGQLQNCAPNRGDRVNSLRWKVVAVGCMLSATTYWLAFAYWDLGTRRANALAASLPHAFLIRGYRPPLEQQLPCRTDLADVRARQPNKTLVLVASPTCPACELEVTAWTKLLGRINPGVHIALVFVSIGGSGAFDSLRRPDVLRGMLNVDCQVASASLFAATTGIPATPTTLVLDEASRVLLSWPTRLADRVTDVIVQTLNHEPGETTR
jgi:hypothetical protein